MARCQLTVERGLGELTALRHIRELAVGRSARELAVERVFVSWPLGGRVGVVWGWGGYELAVRWVVGAQLGAVAGALWVRAG